MEAHSLPLHKAQGRRRLVAAGAFRALALLALLALFAGGLRMAPRYPDVSVRGSQRSRQLIEAPLDVGVSRLAGGGLDVAPLQLASGSAAADMAAASMQAAAWQPGQDGVLSFELCGGFATQRVALISGALVRAGCFGPCRCLQASMGAEQHVHAAALRRFSFLFTDVDSLEWSRRRPGCGAEPHAGAAPPAAGGRQHLRLWVSRRAASPACSLILHSIFWLAAAAVCAAWVARTAHAAQSGNTPPLPPCRRAAHCTTRRPSSGACGRTACGWPPLRRRRYRRYRSAWRSSTIPWPR